MLDLAIELYDALNGAVERLDDDLDDDNATDDFCSEVRDLRDRWALLLDERA